MGEITGIERHIDTDGRVWFSGNVSDMWRVLRTIPECFDEDFSDYPEYMRPIDGEWC